jgi:hypothetical protein
MRRDLPLASRPSIVLRPCRMQSNLTMALGYRQTLAMEIVGVKKAARVVVGQPRIVDVKLDERLRRHASAGDGHDAMQAA